ncbi:MAG: hypothetical protein ACFBWO_08645 [Paracoccaceae bacterium]
MSAALLPFRRSGFGWSNEERSLLARVERLLADAGLWVEAESGETEEGDPWCVFCHADSGDVVVHLARIDDAYVLDSPVIAGSITGRSLDDCADRFLSRARLLSAAATRGASFYIHPTAMLAGVLMTIVMFSLTTRERGDQATVEEGEADPAGLVATLAAAAGDVAAEPDGAAAAARTADAAGAAGAAEGDADGAETVREKQPIARARQAAGQLALTLAAVERTPDAAPLSPAVQWGLLHAGALAAALTLDADAASARTVAEAASADPAAEDAYEEDAGARGSIEAADWRVESLAAEAVATSSGGGRAASRETAADAREPAARSLAIEPRAAVEPSSQSTPVPPPADPAREPAQPVAATSIAGEAAGTAEPTPDIAALARESLAFLIAKAEPEAPVAFSEAFETLVDGLAAEGAALVATSAPTALLGDTFGEFVVDDALLGFDLAESPSTTEAPVSAVPIPAEPSAAGEAALPATPSAPEPAAAPAAPALAPRVETPERAPPGAGEPAATPIWENFVEIDEATFFEMVLALADFGTINPVEGDVLYFYNWYDVYTGTGTPDDDDFIAVGVRFEDDSAGILIALEDDVAGWLT